MSKKMIKITNFTDVYALLDLKENLNLFPVSYRKKVFFRPKPFYGW